MKKVSEVFKVGENNIGWVDSSFTKEFGNDEVSDGAVLSFNRLERPMNDSEIIKELNIQECTLGDILRTMQEAPAAMKDGYYNIFYVKDHPSRVVRVYWGSGLGEWGVDVWSRDVRSWDGGHRVFSPATVPASLNTLASETLTLDAAIKICKENGLKVVRNKTIEEEL